MKDYTYEMALTMLPGVGCNTQRQLLDVFDDARSIFELPANELRQIFKSHPEISEAILTRSMMPAVEREMAFVEKNHIRLLYYTEPPFPQRLNRPDCNDTPILLYALGDSDFNAKRMISVVGTRAATDYGRDMTQQLLSGLRSEGITVVSGLALGIDAAAHEGALSNDMPTIGVLAHGLDQLYPAQNRKLAKRMLENGGSLVTEIVSGTPIKPTMFPVRNRIIASLSDATVVVEASRKGGALITANIAFGYQRDLFAIPGAVGAKYSEGCNAIIAACKAVLIRDADDLMFNMNWERHSRHEGKQTTLFPTLVGDEATLYNLLQQHPGITMEEIRDNCQLPLPKIATALLSLELKNLCRCLPGKIYKPL